MNERLDSLDALRGFDMLWIMGGGSLAIAVSKALGFAEGTFVYDQMHHAAWHGLRFMDTVFPLFLFILLYHMSNCPDIFNISVGL